MAVENTGLGKEGDSVVLQPKTFGHIADNVVLDWEAIEHLLDTVQGTRIGRHHINGAASGDKFLNFLCNGIGPVRREILRFAIQFTTVAVIELHAGNIH